MPTKAELQKAMTELDAAIDRGTGQSIAANRLARLVDALPDSGSAEWWITPLESRLEFSVVTNGAREMRCDEHDDAVFFRDLLNSLRAGVDDGRTEN